VLDGDAVFLHVHVTIDFFDGMNRGNVGMIQRRRSFRLNLEALTLIA
jgi:hypothetical protein